MHMDEALVRFGASLLSSRVVLQVWVWTLLPVGNGIEIEVVRWVRIWVALTLQRLSNHPISNARHVT